MKVDIYKLIDMKLISLRKLGSMMWPDIPATQAGVKLNMKVNKIQGNRLTEEDQKIIENILK